MSPRRVIASAATVLAAAALIAPALWAGDSGGGNVGGSIDVFVGSTPTPISTPTATPDGCATTTPNVPDGPDPWGGCWPGPSNTGPDASEASMAAYTGPCEITAANVTINSKVVDCSTLAIDATANGLLIENSYLHGGVISFDGATFTMQDDLLDNAIEYAACTSPSSCSAGLYACGDPNNQTTECGVGYSNYTLERTEVMDTNRGAYCQSNCTIQDNYFHGTTLWPDHTDLAHASGVRNEQGDTLHHNSIFCDFPGEATAPDLGCSADMSGYPDFAPIKDDTISNNLYGANPSGQAYCAYGGSTNGKPFSTDPTNATNIKFIENVFQKGSSGKCGEFGWITDFDVARTGNEWSGNTFDDGTVAGDGS